MTYATLDSIRKQCSDVITDGEETQEQIFSPSESQHFSIVFLCYQGHSRNQRFRWLVLPWAQKSKNRYCLWLFLFPNV